MHLKLAHVDVPYDLQKFPRKSTGTLISVRKEKKALHSFDPGMNINLRASFIYFLFFVTSFGDVLLPLTYAYLFRKFFSFFAFGTSVYSSAAN